jgi:cell division protein FtsL
VIDRLIHSRAWIPVLGVLLSGIVFMQVEVLKLNANMGRAIQASSALQSRNELLRNTVSALSDDQRIESLAAKNGMVMPAPDAPAFLSPHARVAAAIANIQAPNPTAFTANLPSLTNPVTSTSVPPATSAVSTTALPGVPGGVTPGSTATGSSTPSGG